MKLTMTSQFPFHIGVTNPGLKAKNTLAWPAWSQAEWRRLGTKVKVPPISKVIAMLTLNAQKFCAKYSEKVSSADSDQPHAGTIGT